jgi:uncharacterized alkaline shock family protein YloU
MAEGSTQGGAHPGTAITQQSTPDGLVTDKGQTTIADGVVTKVAGIAAREVSGVHRLGGGVARALGSVTQRLPGSDNPSQGVSVEAGDREAAVDVTVIVEYGESIPDVAQQIRDNIIRRVEGMTGLKVVQVNVAVNDLHFAGDDDTNDGDR